MLTVQKHGGDVKRCLTWVGSKAHRAAQMDETLAQSQRLQRLREAHDTVTSSNLLIHEMAKAKDTAPTDSDALLRILAESLDPMKDPTMKRTSVVNALAPCVRRCWAHLSMCAPAIGCPTFVLVLYAVATPPVVARELGPSGQWHPTVRRKRNGSGLLAPNAPHLNVQSLCCLLPATTLTQASSVHNCTTDCLPWRARWTGGRRRRWSTLPSRANARDRTYWTPVVSHAATTRRSTSTATARCVSRCRWFA